MPGRRAGVAGLAGLGWRAGVAGRAGLGWRAGTAPAGWLGWAGGLVWAGWPGWAGGLGWRAGTAPAGWLGWNGANGRHWVSEGPNRLDGMMRTIDARGQGELTREQMEALLPRAALSVDAV
ncbi:MAG: hypothetical protein LBD90_03370, partial [Bifidobacteriaceae bacterium]|nr:hypothetical protein [Bifidobacteriaceae bacterium]